MHSLFIDGVEHDSIYPGFRMIIVNPFKCEKPYYVFKKAFAAKQELIILESEG